jgi:iron complex outermembrane receptor protein
MNVLERGRGAWLLVALVGLLLNGAPLQGQSGTISGRVLSDQGEPIAGAQVQVLGSRSTRGAVTDASGRFSVSAPAGGSYRLRVDALGYRSVERELSRAADGTTMVELALETAPVAVAGVVVSATRTQTPVAAIPGAVSVVTQAQVEEQAALNQNIGDLLAQVVPGLGAGMQAPGLHGQSLRGRNISVLIDGVPQSTTRNVMRDLSTIDPAMIERVEVLRGATAIYGDGATGGVINIITRAPAAGGARFTTTLGGEVSGSEWSEGTGGRLAQSVSGRSGALDYVVSGTLNRVGDYYDAEGDLIPSDPHGQGGLAETTGHDLFGKFGFEFGTRRLQLSANRYVSEQETQYVSDLSVDALPAGTVKARPVGGLQLAENQGTENTQVSLNFTESDLLGSRLRGQLFHRDYRTVFRPYDARAVASRAAIIQSWLESEKTGGRLEVESPLPLGRESMVLWGADYTRETTSQPVHVFDNDVYDESGGLVFEKIDERIWVPVIQPRSLGLFAQIAFRPVERVMLRGGVRHERARMEVPDFTTLVGQQVTGGELEFDPTLFNVGAVVDATEALSLYASFSQGFSLTDIGLALRDAPGGAIVGRREMEAQTVDQYESGVRGMWRSVQASLAAFRTDSELGTTSRGYDQPVVRAPERVYGVEATLDVQPARELGLGGTFGWTEGESFVASDSSWHAMNGYRIQPWKATAYAEHRTLPGWSNRVQVLYSGDRDRAYTDRINPDRVGFGERAVESYWVADWITRVEVGPGTLGLGVQNVLNRQYFPVVSQLLRTGGNSSYTAARGRTLNLSYTVSY